MQACVSRLPIASHATCTQILNIETDKKDEQVDPGPRGMAQQPKRGALFGPSRWLQML